MFISKFYRFILFTMTLMLCACGLPLDESNMVVYPETYHIDQIKLISTEIIDPKDTRTYNQATYVISATTRLLMRFKDASEKSDSVYPDKEHRVYIQVELVRKEDDKKALAHLAVCPIVSQWFILATWKKSIPPAKYGYWNTEGGDLGPDCSKAIRLDEKNSSRISFDVTDWYLNYPKGRGYDYGLALISDEPIEIYGDLSSSYSPRIELPQSREITKIKNKL